jgi:ribosome-binding protein aMBF1 (putative translation factor)
MNRMPKPIAITADTVILSRRAWNSLQEALEDAQDRAALRASKSGKPDAISSALVRRILGGESPVRIWREHRGLSGHKLATAAGISPSYLHEIEAGKKPGSAKALKALAGILKVDMDDLVA